MKKTYIHPQIEVTHIACTTLLCGSITSFTGLDEDFNIVGESDGGLEAESHAFEFDDFGADDFDFSE